jgi:hypothetical protein
MKPIRISACVALVFLVCLPAVPALSGAEGAGVHEPDGPSLSRVAGVGARHAVRLPDASAVPHLVKFSGVLGAAIRQARPGGRDRASGVEAVTVDSASNVVSGGRQACYFFSDGGMAA